MIARLWLVLLVLATTGCTQVFFQPQHALIRTPQDIGLRYEDVTINTADGLKLHAWFLPAKARATGTVLFLHGNAENISTHIASVYWLPSEGFNVLLLDYRGYGQSQGVPSLAGAQADIDSAVHYLLSRADVDPNRIVVFGQSLGGALAIYYVAHSRYRAHIRALVVESAFADYRAIAQEKLGNFWLTWVFAWPLSYTVDNDYSPVDAVGKISPIPLLIIHGDTDSIVPIEHGRRLYDAANEPKQLWVVQGGGHIQAFRYKEFRERLVNYLNGRLR